MTYDEARDEMLGIFSAAWAPTGFPARYPDIPEDKDFPNSVWARVTIRHGQGGQSSLAGDVGKIRWRNQGTIFVSVFAPVGDGLVAAYTNAQVVASAYRKAKGRCVWFRNQRIRELGQDGAFSHVQFSAEFQYDHME